MKRIISLPWLERMAKRFLALSLFFRLLPVPALSQSAAPSQATEVCNLGEIFNRRGWKIPGLFKARIKQPRHNVEDPEIKDLLFEVLKPVVPADSMTIVAAAPGRADMLEVFDERVDVIEIQRFILNDHIFGYLVIGNVVGTDAKGKKIPLGKQDRFYYYDPDGSGRFKIMRGAGGMSFKIVVPDWVKHVDNSWSLPPS